jgi:hypothetical protein
MHTHHFENLEDWKRGCREIGIEPLNTTAEIIEETRVLSNMLGALIERPASNP